MEARDEDPVNHKQVLAYSTFQLSQREGNKHSPQQEATDLWVEAKLTSSAFPDPLEDQGDYLPGKAVKKVPLDGCAEKTRGEKTWQSA